MNACLGLANRFSDSRAFSVFNEFSQKVKGEVRGFVYFPRPQWQRQFYPSTASVTTTSSCNDSDNDDSILRRPWRFHPSMAVAISSLNDSGNGARFYPLVATTFDFIPQRQVIAHLLKPRGWKPSVRRQFFLDCNEIADLCDSAVRIFSSEPSVLQIKAPAKIFGDLHGQFGDLMRLFDEVFVTLELLLENGIEKT